MSCPSQEGRQASPDHHHLQRPTSVRCCSSSFTFFSAVPKAPASAILPAVIPAWGETEGPSAKPQILILSPLRAPLRLLTQRSASHPPGHQVHIPAMTNHIPHSLTRRGRWGLLPHPPPLPSPWPLPSSSSSISKVLLTAVHPTAHQSQIL